MNFKRFIKEKDYSKLPSSRKEQFKDIFRNDFALIVDINLLILLFSLPLFVLLYIEYTMLATLTELTFNKVFPVVLYLGLIAPLLFGFRGLAKGASYGLLKIRIFNEGCVLIPTFMKLIKKNYIYYFFNYFLLGLAYLISSCGVVYFLYLNANSIVRGLGIGLFILYFAISYVEAQYFMNLDNLYELTFYQCLKNAYSFTFISFPTSILFFIVSIALPIFLITITSYLSIVVLLIFALFYDGVCMLLANLYSYSKFDYYVNKDNFPSYYKKGLSKEDEQCQS